MAGGTGGGISGLVFLILTLTRAREAIINAIPMSLKYAVSVGIGLFIALIGLKNAGLIVFNPATGSMGMVNGRYFSDPALMGFLSPGTSVATVGLAVAGLLITGALVVLKVRGALLWGILATFVLGIPAGVVATDDLSVVGLPTGISQTLFAWDFKAVFGVGLVTIIFTFTFVDLFDTVGTLVGVASKAEMLDESGHLPRANRALLADSIATMAGAALGTSTTTTYIESAAGVAEGGRTGLTAITTGVLFLIALIFAPLVQHIPTAATAPVLIIVGIFLMEPVRRIDFSDYAVAIPAFFTIVMMPLAFSIAEGILAFTFLRTVCGRAREINITLWILTLLFLLRFWFV